MANQSLQHVPKVNIFLHWIASFVIWAMGWKLEGTPPDRAKAVYVGAHHTANFDVFLMIMMSWKLRIRMSYLVANDLKFPLNVLSQAANGIPIDRNNPNNNTVDQVVEYINNTDRVALMIAPEGRLRKMKNWRSGFYYIALGAGIPIVPGFMDYGRKTIGLGESFEPSGDIEADMAMLREFYSGVTARFPEKASPVQVRQRTQAMQDRLADRVSRNNDVEGETDQPTASERTAS
ncbi:MAG: 1-acyl-sn-glycerol-3-phosphate acyltransferase [Chloroflexota bacterium]